MVAKGGNRKRGLNRFQYSLCRVVLMVVWQIVQDINMPDLSVLALSSRFDGQILHCTYGNSVQSFSTRSVESF